MLIQQKYCCGFKNYGFPKGRTGKISLCPRGRFCYRQMDWLLLLTWAMRPEFSIIIVDHVKRTIGEDTSPVDLYSPLQHCSLLLPIKEFKEKLWAACPTRLCSLCPPPAPPWAPQTSGSQRLTAPLCLRGYFCAACLPSVPRSLINILFQILWTSGIWLACLPRQLYPFSLVKEGWRLKLSFFGKIKSKLSSLLLQWILPSIGIAVCRSI